MSPFPIEGFAFYPGLTDDEMLQVRLALGAATASWRDQAVAAAALGHLDESATCDRIADKYSALWGKFQDIHNGKDAA